MDFEYTTSIRKFKNLLRSTEEHFSLNLSMLLQWSPYKTKTELMKQVKSHCLSSHNCQKFIVLGSEDTVLIQAINIKTALFN